MDSLAGAVILQAVKDWEKPENRAEILRFLDSDWFYELAEVAGLERKQAVAIKTKLVTGSYTPQPLRAAYRSGNVSIPYYGA